jgi:ribosomal protein S18 acetylase RimI-like enzyme
MRAGSVAAGCGGVELFGTEYAEIKRMYVRPSFRRLGLGKQMLAHLAHHAGSCGVRTLRLETGIHQRAAIALYEANGFARIAPFGGYREDPLSAFYEKRI